MTVRHAVSMMVAAYNEQAGLEAAVLDALTVLNDFEDFEVIIVNDGSTDATPEIAERLAREHAGVRVIHHPVNRGVAAVYRTGLEAATKEYFTWIGGDHEIAIESVAAILHAIGKADLVIPYHATPGERAWHRRVVTWLATQEINWLFGWPLRYYQGPTVYPREFALSIPVENQRFFFASEMLIRALLAGCSWVEVGLRHQERTDGRSGAVRANNLVSAQLTVMSLWLKLRLGFGRQQPLSYPGGQTWREPAAVTAIHTHTELTELRKGA